MSTNRELVTHLLSVNALRSKHVTDAFVDIDRKDFVPDEKTEYAYEDRPLEIGSGQTISQPYTVALMLEWLDLKPGMSVLDVGSGSGWTTALLAHIVGESGSVVGVERVQQLVEFGRENLLKYSFPNVRIELAQKEFGWVQDAPFDRILVSAAADPVPQTLIEQLSDHGILVMPVGSSVVRITKEKNDVSEERFEGFSFVPLLNG